MRALKRVLLARWRDAAHTGGVPASPHPSSSCAPCTRTARHAPNWPHASEAHQMPAGATRLPACLAFAARPTRTRRTDRRCSSSEAAERTASALAAVPHRRKRSCGTLHPGPPAAVVAPGVGTKCSPRRTPWARLVVKASTAPAPACPARLAHLDNQDRETRRRAPRFEGRLPCRPTSSRRRADLRLSLRSPRLPPVAASAWWRTRVFSARSSLSVSRLRRSNRKMLGPRYHVTCPVHGAS
jgi:hypothetical protein